MNHFYGDLKAVVSNQQPVFTDNRLLVTDYLPSPSATPYWPKVQYPSAAGF
jgi:hypothetical protein